MTVQMLVTESQPHLTSTHLRQELNEYVLLKRERVTTLYEARTRPLVTI